MVSHSFIEHCYKKKWIAIAAAISILGSQIFDGLFLKQTYAAGFYMNGS